MVLKLNLKQPEIMSDAKLNSDNGMLWYMQAGIELGFIAYEQSDIL